MANGQWHAMAIMAMAMAMAMAWLGIGVGWGHIFALRFLVVLGPLLLYAFWLMACYYGL
jgi:hypothetical protein